MIEVLFFSDRSVRERLFAWLERAPPLLLVTGVRAGKWMRPPAEREPFAGLERDYGAVLTQVLVADEGTVEGMWRDPVGDLADQLFAQDPERAYAAASGYVVLVRGEVEAVVKKTGSVSDDRWFLQEALASAHRDIPRPDPSERPGPKRRRTSAAEAAERTPPRPRPAARSPGEDEGEAESRGERSTSGARPEPPKAADEVDPYAVLGVAPTTTREEARRAMRALVAQYHPDKVAHLAPEFRELAERRTRELLTAWERIDAAMGEEELPE